MWGEFNKTVTSEKAFTLPFLNWDGQITSTYWGRTITITIALLIVSKNCRHSIRSFCMQAFNAYPQWREWKHGQRLNIEKAGLAPFTWPSIVFSKCKGELIWGLKQILSLRLRAAESEGTDIRTFVVQWLYSYLPDVRYTFVYISFHQVMVLKSFSNCHLSKATFTLQIIWS